MGENYSGRFAIPDVPGTEPIESIVARLRRDIASDCSGLLRRAKTARVSQAGSYRARVWESRICRIIEANATTFSILELRRLKRECTVLSQELRGF
ncbi:MAG: hypothetical protein AB1529_02230 [Candidatus Micrarchaeota archaeon]